MQASVPPCPPPLKPLADGTGPTTRRPLSSEPRALQCACVATPLQRFQRAAQTRASVFTPAPHASPVRLRHTLGRACACALLSGRGPGRRLRGGAREWGGEEVEEE